MEDGVPEGMTYGLVLTVTIDATLQRGALALTLRFCLFLLGSSLWNPFFAWLHSSCGMAHRPVELSGKLVTKPCVRPSAPLCRSCTSGDIHFTKFYISLITRVGLTWILDVPQSYRGGGGTRSDTRFCHKLSREFHRLLGHTTAAVQPGKE